MSDISFVEALGSNKRIVGIKHEELPTLYVKVQEGGTITALADYWEIIEQEAEGDVTNYETARRLLVLLKKMVTINATGVDVERYADNVPTQTRKQRKVTPEDVERHLDDISLMSVHRLLIMFARGEIADPKSPETSSEKESKPVPNEPTGDSSSPSSEAITDSPQSA